MDEKQNKRLSKFLSLVLRHAPEKIGVELDSAGWTGVDGLLTKMNAHGESISLDTLRHIVETNTKKRFGFNSDQTKIRANQGHSVEIEHGFESVVPPNILYHGTGEKSVQSILENGIEKRNRHHVHLSADIVTANNVGQRHGKPVILEISSLKMKNAGYDFYLSENNVWLTEYVPVEYIKNERTK